MPTKVVFPMFAPSTEGEGTPKDSAFKGIHLADPVGVNDLGRAFPQNFLDSKCGSNLVVYGCVLRNSAILDDEVPMACQHPWQRWTQRHHGAIEAAAARNVLIANNRCQLRQHAQPDTLGRDAARPSPGHRDRSPVCQRQWARGDRSVRPRLRPRPGSVAAGVPGGGVRPHSALALPTG